MTLEEFVAKTNNASSQEEVFLLFQHALKSFGYDSVVYSLLTDHASIGRKAGHGVVGNYPRDWMEYYKDKGYFYYDPIPRYAFSTREAYTWEQVTQIFPLSPVQKKIMYQAKDAKLLGGAAVAIYGPEFEVAGVGIASSEKDPVPSKETLSLIRLMAYQFHFAYSRFETINPDFSIAATLSVREREVLNYCAEGKSVSVMADILMISPYTVKFHLKNIYKKLDVVTRQSAVVKGVRLGLIAPAYLKAN